MWNPFKTQQMAELPSGEVMSFAAHNETQVNFVTGTVFDADGNEPAKAISIGGKDYSYMPFGSDDQLPYELIGKIEASSVLSQNKLFNVLTCYGQGMQYKDVVTGKPTTDAQIRAFLASNSMARFMLEQITDMKYFYFAVCAVVLNQRGDRIVQLRHKDACHCRFERADQQGRIAHVIYGNWRNQRPRHPEVLPLLDEYDPLGDLRRRMAKRDKARVFAIVTRFPTPGHQYYPVPYWSSILRDGWYDISKFIAVGKLAKLKNKATIPYLVEIHKDYWSGIFRDEHIVDREQQKQRINEEKSKIKQFVAGIENSGKLWITGFYSTPDGKEVSMVKITRIDTSRDGGDYSQDIAESNNIMCYADNVHPNLVGATPGSAQTNNSGSDKRELFTLKQAIDRAFHDLMEQVHWTVILFNHWEGRVYPDVPIVQLTTLDKHEDAHEVAQNEPQPNNP